MECNYVAIYGKRIALLVLLWALSAPAGHADTAKTHCDLSVSPSSGTIPWSTTAQGGCTTAEDGAHVTRVSLSWGDGSRAVSANGNFIRANHTYTSAGTFAVVLTGRDSKGHKAGSATQHVDSLEGHKKNTAPTCSFSVSPQSGDAPLRVSGSGACKDSDGDHVTTSIAWGDGATTDGSSGTHTYTRPGTYTAVLTGTDTAKQSGTASRQIKVNGSAPPPPQPPPPPSNRPPTCSLSVSSRSGNAPMNVSATANCSDPENALSAVLLDFGDGFYVASPNSSHTYATAGTFTITATASDKSGNVSQPATQTVTLTATPSIYAGISNGQVAQYDKLGNRLATLNSGMGGSMTGMAFDAAGNLYATAFTAAAVAKFSDGALAGTFGSQYNCKPESIVFDSAGNAYVGQAGCSHLLLKFDAFGNLITSYNVATEQTGSDWIDIGSDQCTIYYASEGASVLRYNVCNRQQLSPLTSSIKKALSLRVLPDGGAIVADLTDIIRVNAQGTPVRTYDAAGEDCWSSLTLDDDGTSFWASDYCTSDIVRFNLDSSAPVFQFKSGTPPNTVFGVAVRGASASMSPAGPLVASPAKASINAGQSATFTVAFSPADAASGQTFTFTCAELPVGAQCAFSPGSATANGSGISTTVTISTHAATAALQFGARNFFALLLTPAFPFLLIALPRRGRKRKTALIMGVVLLLLTLCAMVACGGGGSSNSSPPPPTTPSSTPTANGSTPTGTYIVLVRATGGNMQSVTPVTLTVQ